MRSKRQWLVFSFYGALSRLRARLSTVTGAAHKPFYVEFALSTKCNLRCVHCDQWRSAEEPALDAARWKALVEELYSWSGPYFLTIAWGEPFMHRGLLDIIGAAADKGIATVVVTNGTLLDEAAADRVCQSGLDSLLFSIDGAQASTHDATRGVPGTFAKAMASIKLLMARKKRPSIHFSTMLNANNMAEAAGIVRLAEKLGIDGVRFQPIFPGGAGWEALWPADPAQMDRYVDELIEMKRGGSIITNSVWVLEEYKRYFRGLPLSRSGVLCKSYMKFIVRHTGDVYFCRHKDPVGNILETPARELFTRARGRAALAGIASCANPCIMMGCHHVNTIYDRGLELLRMLKR